MKEAYPHVATPQRPLRFLIGLTVLFIVVALGVYIVQLRTDTEETAPVAFSPIYFFSVTDHNEVTKEYLYGAKIITDIESYPVIQDLFFKNQLSALHGTSAVASALEEVAIERAKATPVSDKRVWDTSYYIGNLLISPTKYLHQDLLELSGSATAVLLETVLADVRAGTVALENYFNTAPPNLYHPSLNSQVYWLTPSFPSLTVTEAVTTLYVLAAIDPNNARQYEQQAHQYVNQVLTSGGQFRIDIEYGIALAAAYFSIIQSDSHYQPLLEAARKEWIGREVSAPQSNSPVVSRFKIPDFPYATNFSLTETTRFGYTPIFPAEELTGSLMLTLADTRLPVWHRTLYQCTFANPAVLPYAVDLNHKNFPAVGTSFYDATYTGADAYVFATDDAAPLFGTESPTLSANSLVYRNAKTVHAVTSEAEGSIWQEPSFSKSGEQLAFVKRSPANRDTVDTQLVQVGDFRAGNLTNIQTVATGTSPIFALGDTLLLIDKYDGVYSYSFKTKEFEKIIALPKTDTIWEASTIRYSEDTQLITYTNQYFDPVTLQPQAVVSVYKLAHSGLGTTVDQVLEFNVKDAVVGAALMSAGGRFLAVSESETNFGRSSKVLIYDVINGIVKTEIDLGAFSSRVLALDEWTNF